MTVVPDDWLTSTDDEWAKPSYQPDRFYMSATDGHGHSGKVQVKLKEAEAAQIKKWVEDPAVPYRTMQDFLRDAVHHRLHQLHELRGNGTLDRATALGNLLARKEASRVEADQRTAGIQAIPGMVAEALQQGRVELAAEHCDDFEFIIEDWPPTLAGQASVVLLAARRTISDYVKAGRSR